MLNFDKALDDVIVALANEPLIIEFQKAKDLVFNDEFILSTEQELKRLQQEITRNVMDKALHDKLKTEYEILKHEYDNHPYVVNYHTLLSDVSDLFSSLKTIIE